MNNLGLSSMVTLVLEQVLDIILGEITVETELHVFDFLGNSGVIVIEGRLIDESFVEDTLKEEIEVGHESCVISVLVLHEDGVKSEIDLSLLWISFLGTGETSQELGKGEEGDAPDGGYDSDL